MRMWLPFLCTQTRPCLCADQFSDLNRKICGRLLVVATWFHLMCQLTEYNTHLQQFSVNLVVVDSWHCGSKPRVFSVLGTVSENPFKFRAVTFYNMPILWRAVCGRQYATQAGWPFLLSFCDCLFRIWRLPSQIWGRAMPQWQGIYLAYIIFNIIIVICYATFTRVVMFFIGKVAYWLMTYLRVRRRSLLGIQGNRLSQPQLCAAIACYTWHDTISPPIQSPSPTHTSFMISSSWKI